MEDLEKELKLKLLEQLMDEMDEAALKSKLPKEDATKTPMAKIVEEKVVPLDKAKDEVMKKLQEVGYEQPEIEDENEDEDYGSDLLRRIKEAKKRKMLEQK
jgi:hypothetical protein